MGHLTGPQLFSVDKPTGVITLNENLTYSSPDGQFAMTGALRLADKQNAVAKALNHPGTTRDDHGVVLQGNHDFLMSSISCAAKMNPPVQIQPTCLKNLGLQYVKHAEAEYKKHGADHLLPGHGKPLAAQMARIG
jgi:hypothetical protein